jgi:hypothetical protein
LDVAMGTRRLSPRECGLRCFLKRKLLGLASLKTNIVRQRSGILLPKEGATSYMNTVLLLICMWEMAQKPYITHQGGWCAPVVIPWQDTCSAMLLRPADWLTS